jgi:hypothetical protein
MTALTKLRETLKARQIAYELACNTYQVEQWRGMFGHPNKAKARVVEARRLVNITKDEIAVLEGKS